MHYIINTGKPKANDCYLNTAGLNTTAGCAKMCILPFADYDVVYGYRIAARNYRTPL